MIMKKKADMKSSQDLKLGLTKFHSDALTSA